MFLNTKTKKVILATQALFSILFLEMMECSFLFVHLF